MTYLLLFLALTSNAVANILMKLGAQQFANGLKTIFFHPVLFLNNGYLWGGILFFAVALSLYVVVLSRMNLSVAYPIMTSVGFVIVVGFSVLAWHEQLFWWQWVGLTLILLGVILLSNGVSA